MNAAGSLCARKHYPRREESDEERRIVGIEVDHLQETRCMKGEPA